MFLAVFHSRLGSSLLRCELSHSTFVWSSVFLQELQRLYQKQAATVTEPQVESGFMDTAGEDTAAADDGIQVCASYLHCNTVDSVVHSAWYQPSNLGSCLQSLLIKWDLLHLQKRSTIQDVRLTAHWLVWQYPMPKYRLKVTQKIKLKGVFYFIKYFHIS